MNFFQMSSNLLCWLSCCFLIWWLKICFILLISVWRCCSKLIASSCEIHEVLTHCSVDMMINAFSCINDLLCALYCLFFFFCFLIILKMSLHFFALLIDVDESETYESVTCYSVCFFCIFMLFMMMTMLPFFCFSQNKSSDQISIIFLMYVLYYSMMTLCW